MWKVILDLFIFYGTFFDPPNNDNNGTGILNASAPNSSLSHRDTFNYHHKKLRKTRRQLPDTHLNTDTPNVKVLFNNDRYGMPLSPYELLKSYPHLETAAYFTSTIAYRLALNIATKQSTGFYFRSIADTALNTFVKENPVSTNCKLELTYGLLDINVLGGRLIAKIAAYLKDSEVSVIDDANDFASKLIDASRHLLHNECSSRTLNVEEERIKFLMDVIERCCDSSMVEPIVEPFIGKKTYEFAHKQNVEKALNNANYGKQTITENEIIQIGLLLHDTALNGALYYLFSIIYIYEETEIPKYKTTAMNFHDAYIHYFLQIVSQVVRKTKVENQDQILLIVVRPLTSSLQLIANLLEFYAFPSSSNKDKVAKEAKKLGEDIFDLFKFVNENANKPSIQIKNVPSFVLPSIQWDKQLQKYIFSTVEAILKGIRL